MSRVTIYTKRALPRMCAACAAPLFHLNTICIYFVYVTYLRDNDAKRLDCDSVN